ncbi:MAG: hypothetical protein EAY68_10395 [Bacteroidetes bacterium]|nr:MAG: hypothetical protein EAY68_10395 [Bacteroidota bacterium]
MNVGNLYHLKTIFSVNLNEILFENLTSTMLHLLHPTSAVCGMPIELAKKFIHNHEKHNRKYYAGFLGILNMQELNENVDSDIISIYVNIRCMQIKELEATLYAGAGITQDSNPESEFQETENKFATLLRFL